MTVTFRSSAPLVNIVSLPVVGNLVNGALSFTLMTRMRSAMRTVYSVTDLEALDSRLASKTRGRFLPAPKIVGKA